METKKKAAEESLKKVMQEEGTPSVENLMLALNQARGRVAQLERQLGNAAEAYRDMQVRLAADEFKNRLEFLWRVLFTEQSIKVFGPEFITQCEEEFKEMMFPPYLEEEPSEKEKDA